MEIIETTCPAIWTNSIYAARDSKAFPSSTFMAFADRDHTMTSWTLRGTGQAHTNLTHEDSQAFVRHGFEVDHEQASRIDQFEFALGLSP